MNPMGNAGVLVLRAVTRSACIVLLESRPGAAAPDRIVFSYSDGRLVAELVRVNQPGP